VHHTDPETAAISRHPGSRRKFGLTVRFISIFIGCGICGWQRRARPRPARARHPATFPIRPHWSRGTAGSAIAIGERHGQVGGDWPGLCLSPRGWPRRRARRRAPRSLRPGPANQSPSAHGAARLSSQHDSGQCSVPAEDCRPRHPTHQGQAGNQRVTSWPGRGTPDEQGLSAHRAGQRLVPAPVSSGSAAMSFSWALGRAARYT
jgi:hypothetical protein